MPQVLRNSARPFWEKKFTPANVFAYAKEVLGVDLPSYGKCTVHWKKVSDGLMLDIAKSLALNCGIRSWQHFAGEIPSLGSALKVRKLRIQFSQFLQTLDPDGKSISEFDSPNLKLFPFIKTALLFDPILAKTSIPLGPRGRRLFGNVSDQHLFCVACAILKECPSIKTPDDLKHYDPSLVKTLTRRGILPYLPFANPGKSKMRWKDKSPNEIKDIIQKYVDDNLIGGPNELEMHYSGFMRQIRDHKITITYHKKPRKSRSSNKDCDDFDDDS